MVSYSCNAAAGSAAGSYDIIPNLTDTNGVLTNYSVALNTGSLTVQPAGLTVTAVNEARAYGSANPAFKAMISGFVNGDSMDAVIGEASMTTSATAASAAGNYEITPTLGTLKAANYQFIDFVKGTLAITAAPLSVRRR